MQALNEILQFLAYPGNIFRTCEPLGLEPAGNRREGERHDELCIALARDGLHDCRFHIIEPGFFQKQAQAPPDEGITAAASDIDRRDAGKPPGALENCSVLGRQCAHQHRKPGAPGFPTFDGIGL